MHFLVSFLTWTIESVCQIMTPGTAADFQFEHPFARNPRWDRQLHNEEQAAHQVSEATAAQFSSSIFRVASSECMRAA